MKMSELLIPSVTCKSCRGVTLVELMISGLLGIIISLAVGRAFIGSKEAFMLIRSSAQMQENGRFAVRFLADSVQLAGFKEAGSLNDLAFPSAPGWDTAQVITGTENAVVGFDSITVRYYGYADAYSRDCLGQQVLPSAAVTQRLFLDATTNSLMCEVDNSGTPSVLVEGVERMRITYGVDADADGIVDAYLSANAVEAGNYWTQVQSAKMYVVARAYDSLNTVENDRTYSVGGEDITFNDNVIRDLFSTTVEFKNFSN